MLVFHSGKKSLATYVAHFSLRGKNREPPFLRSDDIDTHTKTSLIRVHRVGQPDQDLSMADEPGHQELCDREQAFVARAIRDDLDLSRHMQDAVSSLAVCLAADESVRSGQPVRL